MITHKDDLLVANEGGKSLAFFEGIRGAIIMIVIGDATVEKRRGLAGRNQTIILQHVKRQRPVLVRVKHHPSTGNTMNRGVNTLRG